MGPCTHTAPSPQCGVTLSTVHAPCAGIMAVELVLGMHWLSPPARSTRFRRATRTLSSPSSCSALVTASTVSAYTACERLLSAFLAVSRVRRPAAACSSAAAASSAAGACRRRSFETRPAEMALSRYSSGDGDHAAMSATCNADVTSHGRCSAHEARHYRPSHAQAATRHMHAQEPGTSTPACTPELVGRH